MLKSIRGNLVIFLSLNGETICIFCLPENNHYVDMESAAKSVGQEKCDLQKFSDFMAQNAPAFSGKHLTGKICFQGKNDYRDVCLLEIALLFWLDEFDNGNDNAGSILISLANSLLKIVAEKEKE